MADVVNDDGTIRKEIRLSASQTKGGSPRTVFIPAKLQAELQAYLTTRHAIMLHMPLFHSANRLGFSANSLCCRSRFLLTRIWTAFIRDNV